MATILITGAGGMVGKKLVNKLISNGHSVHVLTTSQRINKVIQKVFLWSEPNYIIPQEAWKGVDTVIHLAGANVSNRWTTAFKKEIIDSRVKTANAIFRSAIENNIKINHFISVSGTNFYPDPTINAAIESNHSGNGFLTDVCIQWENAALQFKKIAQNVTIFRTGIVLSKNGGLLPKFMMTHKLGVIPTTGNPKNILSWIHIDDIVTLLETAVTNSNYNGIYNAVAPNPVKQIILAKELAIATNRRAIHPNIPVWLLKIVMGENAVLAGTNQNISSQKLQSEGFVFQFPDIQSALKNIYSKK